MNKLEQNLQAEGIHVREFIDDFIISKIESYSDKAVKNKSTKLENIPFCLEVNKNILNKKLKYMLVGIPEEEKKKSIMGLIFEHLITRGQLKRVIKIFKLKEGEFNERDRGIIPTFVFVVGVGVHKEDIPSEKLIPFIQSAVKTLKEARLIEKPDEITTEGVMSKLLEILRKYPK